MAHILQYWMELHKVSKTSTTKVVEARAGYSLLNEEVFIFERYWVQYLAQLYSMVHTASMHNYSSLCCLEVAYYVFEKQKRTN